MIKLEKNYFLLYLLFWGCSRYRFSRFLHFWGWDYLWRVRRLVLVCLYRLSDNPHQIFQWLFDVSGFFVLTPCGEPKVLFFYFICLIIFKKFSFLYKKLEEDTWYILLTNFNREITKNYVKIISNKTKKYNFFLTLKNLTAKKQNRKTDSENKDLRSQSFQN